MLIASRNRFSLFFIVDCCLLIVIYFRFLLGIDSHWRFWVSDGCKYKDGTMQGLCGDCDDDAVNDWATCDDPATILSFNQAALDAISDSCAEGEHQAYEPAGGRKLG